MLTAVIPPSNALPFFRDMPAFLALAHLCEDPLYLGFHREAAKRALVILDNSAHEFGEGFDPDVLVKIALEMNPSELVLPDRLFWGEDTVEMSREAYEFISKRRPTQAFMGVPQGRTMSEWGACLEGLLPFCDVIGISKDYEVWPGGLYRLVKEVRSVAKGRPIHMLGLGREPEQLRSIATEGLARSVDSAKPIVYAYAGIPLLPVQPECWPAYPKRPKGYFNLNHFPLALAKENTQAFMLLASYTPERSFTQVI